MFMISILLFLVVSTLTLSTWNTYEPERLFSLVNTDTSQAIQVGIVDESLITLVHQVKLASYLFHDGANYFQKRVETHSNQTVLVQGSIGDSFNVTLQLKGIKKAAILFTGRNNRSEVSKREGHLQHQSLRVVSSGGLRFKWCSLESIGMFDDIKEQSLGNSLLLIFESATGEQQTISLSNGGEFKDPSLYKTAVDEKCQKFIQHYQLDSQFKPIILHAICNTIGSISFRKTKSNQYLELKSKYSEREEKPNLGLSALIIDILSHFDQQLQKQLFHSFVERLEDESIYSKQEHFFMFPEHTEIFLKFPHPKSIKILNSMIYHTLFHKVNHAIGHQSADYHSSKEMHPVLKKLLQISWESEYNFLKGNSIYTESFLDDAYIHSSQQEAEISVSKTAWLLKTIRVLIQLNKKQKVLSTEQLTSLQGNLRQYFKSTCYSKQEKLFKSINSIERSRYYSKDISYQSYLPFIYKIEPKYEEGYSTIFKITKNMTTEKGVMSQERSEHNNPSYNFRGRIWPYFNHKIVEMFSTPQNMMDEYVAKDVVAKGAENIQQLLGEITKLLKKVETFEKTTKELITEAVQTQILSDWESKKQLYSSWSQQGESFPSHPQLILINTLFLK